MHHYPSGCVGTTASIWLNFFLFFLFLYFELYQAQNSCPSTPKWPSHGCVHRSLDCGPNFPHILSFLHWRTMYKKGANWKKKIIKPSRTDPNLSPRYASFCKKIFNLKYFPGSFQVPMLHIFYWIKTGCILLKIK